MSAYLELSFNLGSLEPARAEEAAAACGARAVTFVNARDDVVHHPANSGPTSQARSSAPDETLAGTAVFEPAPGEMRLWPATRVRCLFAAHPAPPQLVRALAAQLDIEAALIEVREIADRAWEREWLKDFHALRFGERLWVCPWHERVGAPGAIVVHLDPGLAFGTGTHPSTALCLGWLERHLTPGTRVIDYGCGSGILALAAAKLGAAEVHAFDIDPQALIATRDNARANSLGTRLEVHASAATLPRDADVLVANILAGVLCTLVLQFAALLRPRGQVVLGGLMEHETPDVTDAYAACFDVARIAACDGWVCVAGRRR